MRDLILRFRDDFRSNAAGAYRDWFRLQEELREKGEAEDAAALAEDLWSILPELAFDSAAAKARFHHNLGAFFGSPGPAADLSRARACFSVALSEWSSPEEAPERARVQHNLAGALCNLGTSAEELREAVALYERALEWRTAEREVARAVTLHNLGLAWRRLTELAPERCSEALERSGRALREALEIRDRRRLREGHASSLFQLGLTLSCLAEAGGPPCGSEARQCFEAAAAEFEALGMQAEALAAEREASTRENPG